MSTTSASRTSMRSTSFANTPTVPAATNNNASRGSMIMPPTAQPPNPTTLQTEQLWHTVLQLYYQDPVAVVELLQHEAFRSGVAINNTAFEEMETPSPFEHAFQMALAAKQDSSNLSPLNSALKQVIVQGLLENDRFSPLLAFQVLLFKRIQILDRVQEFQNAKLAHIKKLKQTFENLILYPPPAQQVLPPDLVTTGQPITSTKQLFDENVLLLKNLLKAMQKTDEKKGLFAKLRKSRGESVFKLLAKHSAPLTMSHFYQDMTPVRNYLWSFATATETSRKRRSKALMSLLLLSLSRGSLLDMLYVLHACIDMSRYSNMLSLESSDEGGIYIRTDMIKGLQRLSDMVREQQKSINVLQSSLAEEMLKKTEYAINAQTGSKKCIEVRRLFVFILAHLDLLAQCYTQQATQQQQRSSKNSLLFWKRPPNAPLNIYFVVEALPKTFECILDLLEKLFKGGVTPAQPLTPSTVKGDEAARLYSIQALLRLLLLNLESLALWKTEKESVDELIQRLLKTVAAQNASMATVGASTSPQFLQQMRQALLAIVEQNTEGLSEFADSQKENLLGKKMEEKPSNYSQTSTPNDADFDATFKEDEEDDYVVVGTNTNKPAVQVPTIQPPAPIISTTPSNAPNYKLKSPASAQICDLIVNIICTGFNLFFPSIKEQIGFIMDALKYVHVNPFKRKFLVPLLKKVINDATLFDNLMIQGLGVNENAVPYLDTIIAHLKEFASRGIMNLVHNKAKSTFDEEEQEMASLLCNIVLMWQNYILKLVSSAPLRTKKTATLPVCTFTEGTGKCFVEYSCLVLQSGLDLLLKTCTALATNPSLYKDMDLVLRKSIVGGLMSPLLQGYAKMLWRYYNSKMENQQMEFIAHLLFPYLNELLRCVDSIHALANKANAAPKDWKVVETEHPYAANMNEKIDVPFDATQEVLLNALKFDPRCRTLSTNDNLRLATEYTTTISQVLQFCGQGSSIPSNPIITWGHSVVATFLSDEGKGKTEPEERFGMRVGVFPVPAMDWTFELQRIIAWLGGRCATFVLASNPTYSEEWKFSSWFTSRLFSHGMDRDYVPIAFESSNPTSPIIISVDQQPAKDSKQLITGTPAPELGDKEFVSELQQLQNAIALGYLDGDMQKLGQLLKRRKVIRDAFLWDFVGGKRQAAVLSNYMYEELKMESMMLKDVQEIIAVEKALIAVMLKHADLDILAMNVTCSLLQKEKISRPAKLVSVWRAARAVRTWMAQQKQRLQLPTYVPLRDKMLNRVKFLMQLQNSQDRDTVLASAPKAHDAPRIALLEGHHKTLRNLVQNSQQVEVKASPRSLIDLQKDRNSLSSSPSAQMFNSSKNNSTTMQVTTQIRELNKKDALREMKVVLLVWKVFRRWKMKALDSDSAEIQRRALKDITDQISSFVQTSVIVPTPANASEQELKQLQDFFKLRSERANARGRAFGMYSSLLLCSQNPIVKSEIIHGAKDILYTNLMRRETAASMLDFHYFNNIEGCSPVAYELLTGSFYNFLRDLVHQLDQHCVTSNDASALQNAASVVGYEIKDEGLHSSILREVLDSCFMSFKASDIAWILDFDMLKKLSPMMYHSIHKMSKEDEQVTPIQEKQSTPMSPSERGSFIAQPNAPAYKSRFKCSSSTIEDRNVVTIKAWKVFKLLSLRCIDMLENWEKEQYQVAWSKRHAIRDQLDILRDRIFMILFDELEMIIQQGFGKEDDSWLSDNMCQILEEMLSLMASLCTTQSAQKNLNTPRFQTLLLPLLRITKLQELALKLCGQLILNQSQSEQLNQVSSLNIVSILFDFLGTYKWEHVTGTLQWSDVTPYPKAPVCYAMSDQVAKQVFVLLRQLLHPTDKTTKEWQAMMQQKMIHSLQHGPELFTTIASSDSSNPLDITLFDKIKHMLAAITLLNGFKYIPNVGETVKVLVAPTEAQQDLYATSLPSWSTLSVQGQFESHENRPLDPGIDCVLWEDATVIRIEEQAHNIVVEFANRKQVMNSRETIAAEHVKCATDEALDGKVFDPLLTAKIDDKSDASVLPMLCVFAESVGDMLFSSQGYKKQNAKNPWDRMGRSFQLLFSGLWCDTFQVLYNWISLSKVMSDEKKSMLKLLFKDGFYSKLTYFAEQQVELIQYGKKLKLNSCSFAITGRQFTRQFYSPCNTCQMASTRAVCAFCAKSCHRGHKLGAPEVGEFYCDCGAGEGKTPCKSLFSAPEDKIYSRHRLESLLLRMQSVMPVFGLINSKQQEEPLQRTTSFLPSASGPSLFTPVNATTGYAVTFESQTGYEDMIISFSWTSANGFSMIGTDVPVSAVSPGFYFECEVLNMPKAPGGIAIGFSEKINTTIGWPEVLDGSLTYHMNQGSLFLGKLPFKHGYSPASNKSDIIGCGWSKQTKTVFFTRNGYHLGTAFSNVDKKEMYPMFVMRGENSMVKVNMGQKPFVFNVAKTYRTLSMVSSPVPSSPLPTSTEAKLSLPATPQPASSSIFINDQQVIELMALGFEKHLCQEALKFYPNDFNGAASLLLRNKMSQYAVKQGKIKPTPPPMQTADPLVDQLQAMGFERSMCIKALKLVGGDDVNAALNLLLEGGVPESNDAKDNDTIDDSDDDIAVNDDVTGLSFLGSDLNTQELDQLTMKSLIQSPDMEVNENAWSDAAYNQLVVDDIMVYDHDGQGADVHSAATSKGQFCIITKKPGVNQKVTIQALDRTNGVMTSYTVAPQFVVLPPPEMRNTSIHILPEVNLTYQKCIGIMYCRALLFETLLATSVGKDENDKSEVQTWSQTWKQDVLNTPQKAYQTLKTLFVDQYHIQHANCTAMVPRYHARHLRLLDALKNLNVLDFVFEEALQEMKYYSDSMPHYRAYDNRALSSMSKDGKHCVKFQGASSVLITVQSNNKIDLASASDLLLFHFDAAGKKRSRVIKGPISLPRRMVMTGYPCWFELKLTSALKEPLVLHMTPATFLLDEALALSPTYPHLALASTVLYMSLKNTNKNMTLLDKSFQTSVKYLTTPYAPFKSIMSDVVKHTCIQISRVALDSKLNMNQLPSLVSLRKLRLELETMQDEYGRFYEKEPYALPVFHAMVDMMAGVRQLLGNDLCTSVLQRYHASSPNKNQTHVYIHQDSKYGKPIKSCSQCALASLGTSFAAPKYFGQEEHKCQTVSAKVLNWNITKQLNIATWDLGNHLVPMELLNVNPSDWFEHVTWLDQIAIVRQLLTCFVQNQGKILPPWVLFEAALETKKKVHYRESPHPYHIIKDAGNIHLPSAKTLFISFDKHSKTHKCDRLIFSAVSKDGDELGSYGGDELKDKTIVVHGNKLFYTFKSVGGDHDCNCNSCGERVKGVRYHCTECDDFDLCTKCIKKPRVHPDTHLFLKIRRPVDCVPAALPHLYTARWTSGAQFRGNVHHNVKCAVCNTSPIRGVRYWCENCEDYNLCETCAEDEYKHHDRMHVFLRVIRPLPQKNQLPPNALPYGLVYEKELDSHWGYLFSVSSSDSVVKHDDPEVVSMMKEMNAMMKEWNTDMDKQLVEYVEKCCNGWQSLEPSGLNPTPAQLSAYEMIAKPSIKSLRYRFVILKLLNRKISRILHLLDGTNPYPMQAFGSTMIGAANMNTLIANLRSMIFKSVKVDAWTHVLTKSVCDIQPISVKLNRHKAAEENKDVVLSERNSMFHQALLQLQAVHPKILSRKNGAYKVTFVGESADDYGGPFRESLTQLCIDLQSTQLPLLIPVPNSQSANGDNAEKFIPHPLCNTHHYTKFYRLMGVILGVGLLNKNVLPLDLPSLFWKYMVRETQTMRDIEAIDKYAVQSIQGMKEKAEQLDQQIQMLNDSGLTDEAQEAASQVLLEEFTTTTQHNARVELIPNGRHIPVTAANLNLYIKLWQQFKLQVELGLQLSIIREGLYSIIPPRYFSLLTWQELELMVCGSPEIDLNVLKKHTIYEGYTAASREVKDFWSVLEGFDSNERSSYLRFVWGRSRLPVTEDGFTHPMKIQRLERPIPDKVLPLSHTCFFSIELPPYSSKKVMRDKMLYAITHCKAIDTDFTTSATEARNANIL